MDTLQGEFRYKIGDVCKHRDTGPAFSVLNGDLAPTKYLVIGRQVEECHGGVQLHYLMRQIDPCRGFSDISRYCEFEMERYPTDDELAEAVRQIKETAYARDEARREKRKARAAAEHGVGLPPAA